MQTEKMTTDQITSKVQEILAGILDRPGLEISAATVADDVEGWDSINHVKLLLAIEEELNIRFNTNEIGHLDDVGQLVALVQQKLG